MRLILSFIAGVCLTALFLSNRPDTYEFEEQWRQACAAVSYEYDRRLVCADIDRPQVVLSSILNYMNADGMFITKEPYLFVNPNQSEAEAEDSLIHEMIHYIVYEIDPELDTCSAEELARRLASEITSIPIDPFWRLNYPTCMEY